MQSEPLAASIFEGRLHPLTIAFSLWKAARGIIPAIPVLYLYGNKFPGFIMLTAMIAMSVATSADGAAR